MKHNVRGKMLFAAIIITVIPLWCKSIPAQDLSDLAVEYGAVCEDVVNREVVAASTSFPSSIEKLYCFTKITGATEPTNITHVWYYGETERARVVLAVKSSIWRTYSSKLIQPGEVGMWRVDVIDSGGRVLETYRFDIYKQP
jgi:hypothetical protein